jgi:type IV secretory pathway component VirB8
MTSRDFLELRKLRRARNTLHWVLILLMIAHVVEIVWLIVLAVR